MLAAGNALVCNPHPSGARIACQGTQLFNQAIHEAIGIDNLITIIDDADAGIGPGDFRSPRRALLCVTGGPAVGRAALRSPKRAIVAGPGNPPVVVDETADLDNAARSIIAGGGLRQQPALHRRKGSLRRRLDLRRTAGRDDAAQGGPARRQADRGADQGGLRPARTTRTSWSSTRI